MQVNSRVRTSLREIYEPLEKRKWAIRRGLKAGNCYIFDCAARYIVWPTKCIFNGSLMLPYKPQQVVHSDMQVERPNPKLFFGKKKKLVEFIKDSEKKNI